jgi:hypothetical protein
MPTENADIFTLAQFGDYDTFIRKFNINDIDKLDDSASLLHYAIAGRKTDIALFLIKSNIKINIQDLEGRTELHYICIYPNIEVAKAILERGGDINIKDGNGNNAIFSAVFNSKGRYYDMVELFMQYNPDINAKNNRGISPLDFAVKAGYEKIINLLLKQP